MPTYDVHQHFLPPQLVAELRARRTPPRLDGDLLELAEGTFPFDERDNDLDERLALLDRDGIDVAIISLAPTMETEGEPDLQDAYHEGILEVVAAAGGRLQALAAGACLEGFAGACVSAHAVLRGLDTLPGELAQAGQMLFVHPGPPAPPADRMRPPGGRRSSTTPRRCRPPTSPGSAAGVERHPELDVVFAILAGGAPIQLERLHSRGGDPDAALHPRLHLDTASYGARALALCAGDRRRGPARLRQRRARGRRWPDAAAAGRSRRQRPWILVRSENPRRLFA